MAYKRKPVEKKQSKPLRFAGVRERIGRMSHGALILLVIALVVTANILAHAVTARIDLSRGHAYTLSASSKQVVSKISSKDPVKLTFYQSSTLPSQLQPVARDVRDLLTEYERAGNVQVYFVDPTTPAQQAEAESAGIQPLQFSLTKRDQLEYSKGYFGIKIEQGKKTDVISQAIQLSDLEYQLTSAIYKLTTKELPTVGFIGDEGIEPQQLQGLRALLGKQFTVESSATPEAKTKALLVFDSGNKTYDQGEIDLLSSYVKKGGNVVVMADGVMVDPSLQVADAKHGLFAWLKSYGMTLNKDLVLSQQSEFINAGAQTGSPFQLVVPYYYWVKTASLNPAYSYFANIQSVSMPWVSSVAVSPVAGVKTEGIVQTSPVSWHQTKDYTLDPQQITEPKQSDLKSFVVAAVAKVDGGGSVMLLPTSRFAYAQFQPQDSGNLNMLVNVVSQFAAGGALSGIRQRDVSIVPLPVLADNERDMVKYATMLLLPLLFSAYGALRLYKRR